MESFFLIDALGLASLFSELSFSLIVYFFYMLLQHKTTAEVKIVAATRAPNTYSIAAIDIYSFSSASPS